MEDPVVFLLISIGLVCCNGFIPLISSYLPVCKGIFVLMDYVRSMYLDLNLPLSWKRNHCCLNDKIRFIIYGPKGYCELTIQRSESLFSVESLALLNFLIVLSVLWTLMTHDEKMMSIQSWYVEFIMYYKVSLVSNGVYLHHNL
ncbi:hypothetical protein Hanom_Chr04g00330701 [Helianthus anomalus]